MYIQYVDGTKKPYKDELNNFVYSPDLETFNTCGIVITDDDIVLDFDEVDKEILKQIITLLNIKTEICYTDRGMHLFFKKPKGKRFPNKAVCKLGLPVEYKKKTGKNHSITRKMNGVPREVFNLGKREELPELLFPYGNKVNTDDFLLTNVSIGNRNNTLFKYGASIKGCLNWEKYLRFANNNLIEQPIEEKEINAIITSLLNYKSEVDKEQSEDYTLALEVIKEKRVYSYKGMLWVLVGEEPLEWSSNEEHIRRAVGQVAKGKSSNMLGAIYNQLKYHAPLIKDGTIFPVRFANGLLENGSFDYDDDLRFSPYTIDIIYDANAPKVDIVDNYLNHLTENDESYKKVVLEMIAHCLITNPEQKKALGKFFFLHGGGGNGKGTLLEIITRILGRENVSNVSPKQLKDERYSNALIGKLANLADDVEDASLDNEILKIMKNVSTCDNIQLRKLNHNAIETQVTATLINTTNHLLKSFEKGDSFKRRMLWLPMFTKVKKHDNTFISRITAPDALSYWVSLIVDAYERLLKNGEFTTSEKLNYAQAEYHKNNNNVLLYFDDIKERDIRWNTIMNIYRDYTEWCEDNCEKPLSKKRVSESIRDVFNLETIGVIRKPNGQEPARYFVPIGYDKIKDREKELKWLEEQFASDD